MNSTVRKILQDNSANRPKKALIRSASVGQRVRELRTGKKLTQSELAKLSGISHSSLVENRK